MIGNHRCVVYRINVTMRTGFAHKVRDPPKKRRYCKRIGMPLISIAS
jgi:hypothetical protein